MNQTLRRSLSRVAGFAGTVSWWGGRVVPALLSACAFGWYCRPLFCRSAGSATRTTVAQIVGEISEFASEHDGRCPRAGETLATRRPLRDPWGSLIEVACIDGPDGEVLARSSGPDRLTDTEDDIVARWRFDEGRGTR